VETRWKLTRRSLTGAALWLILAVVCVTAPFDELADRSDLFDWLGSALGGTGDKYTIGLLLAAVGVYTLRVPTRRRSSTPNGAK
jgi:hypothetical protein